MTPVLFDLPLRLSDAVGLAELIFQHAEGKPMSDDLRSRIGGRAAALARDTMRPCAETLERDPIHPSAYYMCVDGIDGQPLLLRLALASAPSSGLFPKAILIGRTNVLSREIVVNSLPFGPADSARIRTYAEQLNPAYQPKVFGARPVIRVRSTAPAETFPAAFDAFRAVLKAAGQNLACFALLPGQDAAAFHDATVWSAIRAGWREGFSLEAFPETADDVRSAVASTRFGVRSAEMLSVIRAARSRPFDAEWISGSGDLDGELESLRTAGFTVQSIAFEGEPPPDAQAIARRHRAALNTRDVTLEAGMTREQIFERITAA